MLLVLFVVVGTLVLVAAAVVPSLIEEASDFWEDLPNTTRESLSFLRNREPELYARIVLYVDRQTSEEPQSQTSTSTRSSAEG